MASFAIFEEGDGTQNLDDHEEQPPSDDDATLRNPKWEKTKGEPKGRLKGVLEMNVPKKKASSKQTSGQNKHGEINPYETLVLDTTNTYQTSGNDQNNQQEEVSIYENLVLGGTSNTHQPTKKGFVDLWNGQFSGVNDPNQVIRSWPDMSAPPGSIGSFGNPRHQCMAYDSYHQPSLQGYAPHFPSGYLTQKSREEIYAPYQVPKPRGYNQFFQRSYTNIYPQVLANATRSISSMLSESQSSHLLANASGSINSMLGKSQSSQGCTNIQRSVPKSESGDFGIDDEKGGGEKERAAMAKNKEVNAEIVTKEGDALNVTKEGNDSKVLTVKEENEEKAVKVQVGDEHGGIELLSVASGSGNWTGPFWVWFESGRSR
ncbi:hypothetical protein GIB67_008286, partial [Kingdonia uniflora]